MARGARGWHPPSSALIPIQRTPSQPVPRGLRTFFAVSKRTNPRTCFSILRPPQWLRQPVARGCSAPEARRAGFLAFAYSRRLVRALHRFRGSGDDGNTLNLNHRVRRNKRVDID